MSRLNLGQAQFSLSWISGFILAQAMIETVVVSITLNDNANIGILDEILPTLREVLKNMSSTSVIA